MLQIDSLDTLALFGDREQFTAAVEWISKNLDFKIVSMPLKLVPFRMEPMYWHLLLKKLHWCMVVIA